MKLFFDQPVNSRLFLPVLISINFLLHLPFINLPPCSIHVWRQCNTLSVARNFAREDMNILKPRVDRRLDTNGITGMQFPLYEWLLACMYKILFEHYAVSRMLSLILISMAFIAFNKFVLLATNSVVASAVATVSICFSPEVFYQGINAMPDVLSISATTLSLYCLLRWQRAFQFIWFCLSLLFITTAGLVKLQYLMFGAFHLVYLLRNYNAGFISKKESAGIVLAGILAVALPVTWYLYANALIEKSNLRDFVITFRPATDFNTAILILKDNLVSDLPELLLNYSGTTLLLIALAGFFKSRQFKNALLLPVSLTLILYAFYHLTELNQMADHQYYMLPLMLLLPIACAYGALILYKNNLMLPLFILIILMPVLACIRILPARWMNDNKAIPEVFLNTEKLAQLKSMVPGNALVLAGPDESGCIYFYFLDKKGFGYDNIEYVKQQNQDGNYYVSDCIKRGAQYVYSKGEAWHNDALLSQFIKAEAGCVDDFRVYKLKTKEELR